MGNREAWFADSKFWQHAILLHLRSKLSRQCLGFCLEVQVRGLPAYRPQFSKYICPNCKIYLSKLQNIFGQIAKCTSPKFEVQVRGLPAYRPQFSKYIGPNCKMYLDKLQNVPVQNLKCKLEVFLHTDLNSQNIFVQIAKYICPN